MSEPFTTPNQSLIINRREALKALAAAGGALTAAAFLPGQWAKPLVESGVLPAHAQGSACVGPYSFVACPVDTAHWQWDDVTQNYLIVYVATVQVSPPCPDITVCFRMQTRSGEQIVHNSSAICWPTGTTGMLEATLMIASHIVGNADRVGWVVTLGAETCEAFTELPPLPDRPVGAGQSGPSKTGQPYIVKINSK